jgi:hypothetical protein
MVNRYSSSIGTSYCQRHKCHLYLGKNGLNTYAPEGLAVPVSFVPEPEISVGFITLSVAQSFGVYVAKTACPSTESEISVGFIGVYVAQSLVL